MPYGVTPTGFSMPTESDLLALIEADQRAELSSTLDLSESSVLGQNNRIYARQIFTAWQALQSIYDGTDPDRAAADQLTSLSKLTGTERRGASSSTVDVTVQLDKGTRLEAETHYAAVTGHPDERWTPVASFTAPADGTFTLRFHAALPGPLDTPVDSISVIATPVVGWVQIVNSGEVLIGHSTDDDEDLRTRREQALALAGSSTVGAIRADLLSLVGAVACTAFENYSDFTDTNGLPPHSFEAIIEAPDATADQIAQAIWDGKPSGILAVGSSSGIALDPQGLPHTIAFTRPQQLEVYISFGLQRLEGYVGDDLFRETVSARLDAQLLPGATVEWYDVLTSTSGLGARVTSATFGLAASPTGQAPLVVGIRAIARFDAGRIVVTA